MKFKNHLVTGGSLVALLVLSGCQSDSYGNNQNPYLLRPHEDLPPVTTTPKEAAPVVDTTPTVEEPAIEEIQGIGELLQVEEVANEELIIEEPAVVEEPAVIEAPAPTLEPQEERFYSVVRGDSIWKIATKYGISQKMLVKENELDPKKPLLIGQKLKLPAGALAEAEPMLIEEARNKQRKKSSESASARTAKGGTYTVKRGDNLWTIPKRFGVKRSDFLSANGFDKSTVIYVGQKVIIPGASGNLDGAPSGSSSSAAVTYSSEAVASGDTYKVQKGDNLWTIPKKLKVKRADFMSVNGFDSSTILQIGQEVKIPGKGGNSVVEAPASEPTNEDLFGPETNVATPPVTEESLTGDANVVESPNSEPATPEVPAEAPAAQLSHNTYTLDVSDGETLESISLIYSTTPEEIMKYNKSIKSNADLKPGMKLTLPFKE